jgi:hypothetical protein
MEENFVYDNKDGVNRVVDKIKKKQQKQQIQNNANGDATMQSNNSTSTIDSDRLRRRFCSRTGGGQRGIRNGSELPAIRISGRSGGQH